MADGNISDIPRVRGFYQCHYAFWLLGILLLFSPFGQIQVRGEYKGQDTLSVLCRAMKAHFLANSSHCTLWVAVAIASNHTHHAAPVTKPTRNPLHQPLGLDTPNSSPRCEKRFLCFAYCSPVHTRNSPAFLVDMAICP